MPRRVRTRLIATLHFLEEKPAYVDRWVHEVYPHAYLVSPHSVPTSKFPYSEFRKVLVDKNLFRGIYRLMVPIRYDRLVVLAHPISLGAAVNGLLCCTDAPITFQVDVLVRGVPETLPEVREACQSSGLLRMVQGFRLDSIFVRSLLLNSGGSLDEQRRRKTDSHRRSSSGRDVVPPPRSRKTAFNPALDLSVVHQETR